MLQELMFGPHSSMRDIIRFSVRHRIFDESDAAHTFNVIVYTEKICEYLNAQKGSAIDTLLAMRIALHHDIDEVITGDIMQPAKRINEKLKKELREWTIQVCRATLPAWLFNIWVQQFDESPEAQVVRLADWLSALQYMASEAQCGNNWLCSVSGDVLDELRELRRALPACAPIMPEVEALTYEILLEVNNEKVSNPQR